MSNPTRSIQKNSLYLFGSRYKKILIAVGLIFLLFIIGEIAVGNFVRWEQIFGTLKLASFIALFGLCQMIAIAAGGSGLDLSVGFTATITAVLTASVMDGKDENLWLAVLIALAVGLVVGILNGTLIAYLKLPPLVVTLAMANIVQGTINAYTAGRNITGKPSPILRTIAAGTTGPIPNIVFVLIIVAVIVMLVLYKTRWGLKLFGVGSNETTAYLSGVNVKQVRFTAFAFSGIFAGLIGLLLLGNMGNAFKDMGSGYVMPSIAAVVMGGISLVGGEGNFIGVIVGAYFLQTLSNVLIAFNLGEAEKWLIFGIILYALLVLYVRNRRRR